MHRRIPRLVSSLGLSSAPADSPPGVFEDSMDLLRRHAEGPRHRCGESLPDAFGIEGLAADEPCFGRKDTQCVGEHERSFRRCVVHVGQHVTPLDI